MVEALVVIAIIVTVAAITTPIISSAKHSGRITASISNMRQLYMAMQIYRSEYGGNDSTYEFYASGLPTSLYWSKEWFKKDQQLWASPCGARRDVAQIPPLGTGIGYISYVAKYYEPSILEHSNKNLVGYLEEYRQNAVVLADVNCNDRRADLEALLNPYSEKRVLVILLSGQLIHKIKRGVAVDVRFCSELPSG